MAFSVDIALNETCDKCGKPGNDFNRVVELTESNRYERHVIFIHEECFRKASTLAKSKIGLESEGQNG